MPATRFCLLILALLGCTASSENIADSARAKNVADRVHDLKNIASHAAAFLQVKPKAALKPTVMVARGSSLELQQEKVTVNACPTSRVQGVDQPGIIYGTLVSHTDVEKWFDSDNNGKIDAAECHHLLAIFDYFDADGDKTLDKEEWHKMEKVLRLFDTDGDGTLDDDEIAKVMAAIEEVDGEGGDGKLDDTEIETLLKVRPCSLMKYEKQGQAKEVEAYFDADGNGHMDADECKNLRKVFSYLDDGDGELEMAEWEKMETVLKLYDTDNDGTLDETELKFLLAGFDAIDAGDPAYCEAHLRSARCGADGKVDNNEYLTLIEMKSCYGMKYGEGVKETDVTKWFDADGDGRMGGTECKNVRSVFALFDDDGDGELGKEEWDKMKAAIEAVDKDGDGNLDAVEIAELKKNKESGV